MDIGIHRHMILGEIVIDETAIAVVDHGLFMQRHADAADHGAHDLAVRGLGIEDAAGRHRADHARDAKHAELLVEPHLGEHRRVDFVGVSLQRPSNPASRSLQKRWAR